MPRPELDILRTAGKSIPLRDVDLDALAADLDGYSAADCVALLREAALTAMRRSVDAAEITAADVAAARENVRPSLDPAQLANAARVRHRTLRRASQSHDVVAKTHAAQSSSPRVAGR